MTRTPTADARAIRHNGPLAYLVPLLGVAGGLWVLIFGVARLVLAYTVAAGSVVAALLVVTACLYLAVKGNWRARVIAIAIIAALGVLVGWALTR